MDIASSTAWRNGGRPGTEISKTGKVEVTATCFATSVSMVCFSSGPLTSSAISDFVPAAPGGHTSGFLSGTNSVSASSPCSRSSMPISAASRKPIEHRWPVTFSPRLCASSTAAASSARVMSMYTLKLSAPSSAQ